MGVNAPLPELPEPARQTKTPALTKVRRGHEPTPPWAFPEKSSVGGAGHTMRNPRQMVRSF
jgi:hypothetical protein